jgi:hypothetical protein
VSYGVATYGSWDVQIARGDTNNGGDTIHVADTICGTSADTIL